MLLVVLDILGRVLRQTSPDRGRRWGEGAEDDESGFAACGGKAVAGNVSDQTTLLTRAINGAEA